MARKKVLEFMGGCQNLEMRYGGENRSRADGRLQK